MSVVCVVVVISKAEVCVCACAAWGTRGLVNSRRCMCRGGPVVGTRGLVNSQRRFGLYLSQIAALLLQLQMEMGVVYDPLGDKLMNEQHTDKSLPHDSGLRVLHDATQASAAHAVVLGDKSCPEVTAIYNEGCVVDLAEGLMGKGGSDLCLA